ncbi:MAG: hypothetical protein ACMXYC_02895 [Candidatus Woesearchaeota archaeon]
MKYIHTITISVIAQQHEDVLFILQHYLDCDWKKEKISVQHLNAKEEFSTYSIKLHHQRHHKLLLQHLLPHVDYQQMLERIDNEGILYMRLDKASLQHKNIVWVDHGNCYHLRIKFAGYPVSQDSARQVCQHMLDAWL